MTRSYDHPGTENDVTVVKGGVNLTLTQEGRSITTELTQDQAWNLAAAIMKLFPFRKGLPRKKVG